MLESTAGFYRDLGLPESTRLGVRIFKKQLLEQAEFSVADRKLVNEHVDTIEWRYALKPASTGLARFEDDTREYLEIAVLHVRLKEGKHLSRLGELIQRTIPYPLLLVFEVEAPIRLALNLADKRINRADSSKLTVERYFDTGWLDMANTAEVEAAFLADFRASSFMATNLYEFYRAMLRRVTALTAARLCGGYVLAASPEKAEAQYAASQQLANLKQLLLHLHKQAQKEKQISKRVELNLQIKSIERDINAIATKLAQCGTP